MKKMKNCLTFIGILLVMSILTACNKAEPMTIGADGLGYVTVKGVWKESEKDSGSIFFEDSKSGSTIGFFDFGDINEENTMDTALKTFIQSVMEDNSLTEDKFKVEKGIKFAGFDAYKVSVEVDGTTSILWLFTDSKNNIHALSLDALSKNSVSIIPDIEKSFSLTKPGT
ncbi:MAG: hypothetical protein Q4D53_07900 [Leptotrichiaceae bacterium]|nr:hypothetical protein [Leptotrichiaceae bacterium]